MRKAPVLLIFLPSIALADFTATGPIQGQVCSGFIVESCQLQEVSAVKDGGKLYTIGRRYPQVTTYDQAKGRCWINLKANGAGLFSDLANALASTEFHTLSPSGEYLPIEPDYLTFTCIKSP